MGILLRLWVGWLRACLAEWLPGFLLASCLHDLLAGCLTVCRPATLAGRPGRKAATLESAVVKT